MIKLSFEEFVEKTSYEHIKHILEEQLRSKETNNAYQRGTKSQNQRNRELIEMEALKISKEFAKRLVEKEDTESINDKEQQRILKEVIRKVIPPE